MLSIQDLHSTLVLLKGFRNFKSNRVFIFTFYSSSIKSLPAKSHYSTRETFTFYSSSIKRRRGEGLVRMQGHLHSTLVLLKVYETFDFSVYLSIYILL